ncbi:hypothetical protein Btru_056246 [Bulinus truncatus]|nr:hypothetical protein Btru_056246 [Bulinus truncatus]
MVTSVRTNVTHISGCWKNGTCRNGRGCRMGFFGPKCQFRDITMQASVVPRELSGRQTSRCPRHPHNISYGPVNITFMKPVFFQWLQLDVENVGRNLALRQKTSMSSVFKDERNKLRHSSMAVDGDYTGDDVRTAVGDTAPYWEIVFNAPILLDEIVVHNNVDESGSMERFIVQLFHENKSEVGAYEYSGAAQTLYTFPSITREPLWAIRVSIATAAANSVALKHDRANVRGFISIREVEIYGECAPPTYGDSCQEICSLTCVDMKCTYYGQCLQCFHGYHGSHCFQELCHSCTDDFTDVTYERIVSAPTSSKRQKQTKSLTFEHLVYYIMVIVAIASILLTSWPAKLKKN